MRILTYTNLFPNAVDPNFGVFVYQRIRHLLRPGVEVEVVVPVPYIPEILRSVAPQIVDIPREANFGGLKVHYVRYPHVPRVSMRLHARLMEIGTSKFVERLHRARSFDVIDAHYLYPDCVAAGRIGQRLGIPVVMSARGSDVHQFFDFERIRPQIHSALRHAAAIVAVSESLAARMRTLDGVGNVHVIGNGVDSDRFLPVEPSAARSQLGLPPTARIAVCVAGLKPIKGIDLLLEAMATCDDSDKPDLLLLLGKGPERGRLEQLAKTLGIGDRVRFEGAVPNEHLSGYYSAADFSCLTSRNEGWPNVVLESLACGTPVLGTRVGAMPEMLANPEFGIATSLEVGAIRDGLRRMARQTWNRPAISVAARQHSWSAVADEVLSVLESATKK
jgi:teichuronic acid biosynthesis glycosyltransferase TuaC